MKSIAIAAVIAVLASTAPVARATSTEGCCACLASGGAQTSGGTNSTATGALFCAAANSGDVDALGERCGSLDPGAILLCVANIPGPSCAVQLAGEGILCPAAGAPAVEPLNLGTLAVVLAALGALVLRRRRRLG